MATYLYEEVWSGTEQEFDAADMDAAKAHAETLLRAALNAHLRNVQRQGRAIEFPAELGAHVTEMTREDVSWADRDPDVPSEEVTVTAAGFPA
jgi:hypothetical protein